MFKLIILLSGGFMKNRTLLLIKNTISVTVIGVVLPIYTKIISYTHKILFTVFLPEALSKIVALLSLNTYIAAYIVGIYCFFCLVCNFCIYDYDLCNESVSLDVHSIIFDIFTLIVLFFSGFLTGKTIFASLISFFTGAFYG